MNESFESYIETAIWSSAGMDGDIMDEHSILDFDEKFLDALREVHDKFYTLAFPLVELSDGFYMSREDSFGHNLWLTQNGHGAGFWDGYYVHGDEITALCEKFLKPIDLYVGDDYKIYGLI